MRSIIGLLIGAAVVVAIVWAAGLPVIRSFVLAVCAIFLYMLGFTRGSEAAGPREKTREKVTRLSRTRGTP
jgi:uncharacterized protein YacL